MDLEAEPNFGISLFCLSPKEIVKLKPQIVKICKIVGGKDKRESLETHPRKIETFKQLLDK